jgi:hypothetical protein
MSGKCGHERCHCTVTADDFCSDYCEELADAPEVDAIGESLCRCGHAECSERS